jgi:hypothetical protein
MKVKKYYWMSFMYGDTILEDVSIDHPFIVITKLRNKNHSYGSLLNWKQISVDDYDLFNDILYNIDDPKYNQ